MVTKPRVDDPAQSLLSEYKELNAALEASDPVAINWYRLAQRIAAAVALAPGGQVIDLDAGGALGDVPSQRSGRNESIAVTVILSQIQEELKQSKEAGKSVVVGKTESGRPAEWLRGLEDALAALPASYPDRAAGAVTMSDQFRMTVAKALEPALNAHAAAMPHATYDEKKDLAKWVNAELRSLGLAIRGPNTAQPCHLVGNPGNRPATGRFMLNYRDERGRLVAALTSVTLPHLELMPDDLSRGPLGPAPARSR